MTEQNPAELRTPQQWEDTPEIERVVIDPDGWRGAEDPLWDAPITREEYLSRAARSTTRPKQRPTPIHAELSALEMGLVCLRVCTSLGDEAVTAQVNLMHPTGISSRWAMTDRPEAAPVPCMDAPDTHRHIVFDC